LPRSNTDPQHSEQLKTGYRDWGQRYSWTKVQPVYPSTGGFWKPAKCSGTVAVKEKSASLRATPVTGDDASALGQAALTLLIRTWTNVQWRRVARWS